MTELRKLQIPVSLLEVGMFVTELDRSWEDSPFLMQGFHIHNYQDIRAIQEACNYVYIDPYKRDRRSSGSTGARPNPENRPADQGMAAASEVFTSTSSLIKSCMDDIRFGKALDTTMAKGQVAECVQQIIRNPDSMLLLTQLKNRDEYTSQHSMNVCVLAITLGRQLGLAVEQLEHLGLCGLFHDLGKMKVPLEVLNKQGPLTPQEFGIMRQHTTEGRNILMSARGITTKAVDVAFSHHERLDGKGYPRGIRGESLTDFTRMVSIVDAYDAMTSDRCYQNHKSHLAALNILTKGRGIQFDAYYTIAFIQCIGIYPPGSLVELSTGELAIVLEVSNRRKTRPKIMLIRDPHNNPCDERIIDLNAPLPEQDRKYRIRDVHNCDAFGVDLREYIHRLLPAGKVPSASTA